MKDFLHRHVIAAWITSVVVLLVATVIGTFFYTQAELNKQLLQRYDHVANGALPGPAGQLSERSKLQIDTLLKSNPHVLAGYAGRISFGKKEDPIIHVVTMDPTAAAAVAAISKRQKDGLGFSSAELNSDPAQKIRNSDEAKAGLIKCGKVEDTTIDETYPDVVKRVKGICRATIPPFDQNNNLALSVLVDIPAEENSAQVQAIRRLILQLQIDIYNRDYQGRETWAHP